MRSLVVLIFALMASVSFAADIFDRAHLAEVRCGLSDLAEVTHGPPDAEMMRHYRPSTLQRVLAPPYTTIFDSFGGYVQGMISGGDEAHVDYTLRRLGRKIEERAARQAMSTEQKICMATCMVHQLMEPGDPNPWTSMWMAVADGVGFCRHFSLATRVVLKAAGVTVKTETAIDHMFLKMNIRGVNYYYDPMNENGRWSCPFFPASSVR